MLCLYLIQLIKKKKKKSDTDSSDNDIYSINSDDDDDYYYNEEDDDEDDEDDEDYEDDEDKNVDYSGNDNLEKTNEKDEEDEKDEKDEEDEDDETEIKQNIILILKNNKRARENSNNISLKNKKYSKILSKYNNEEKNYFNNLNDKNKDEIFKKEIKLINKNESIPNRFKFLNYELTDTVKTSILYNLEQLNSMCSSSSEYFKLNNWINILAKIPIGKYKNINITTNDDVSNYLKNIKTDIDNNIFGHTETKEQLIRILAQWISNPDKTGYVIGIKGPPGVGKTKLVKECICKAMNFPLAFISLGGIDDSSYLSGFNYTYEGSRYGKILECLIKANVMNPVFLFDELDKVSATSRGDEIINTLIHITDPIQNEKYTDKYFQEIDLDLSKSIIIFTYNNEEYINPILKDRMITINVNGYTAKEKLIIAKKYLIDELLPKFNMKSGDIIFEDKLLEYIISTTSTNENGIRNLKRIINNIISWINMMRYIKIDNIVINLPYTVSIRYYDKYCNKNINSIYENKINSMYL